MSHPVKTSSALLFCLQLDLAHARLRRKLDDELGTLHGLGFADLVLLQSLADGARAAGELERPLGTRASQVIRQVMALEKSGWLERCEQGGRRVVALRPPGRRLLGEAMETAAHICGKALPDALAGAEARLAALCDSPALELR